MAQLTQGRVDIISREDGTLISQTNSGSSHTVILNQPSVVRINGTREMVAQYERQGNDLVLHMRDGSTVRYQKFFFDDLNGEHSELVFDDGINPAEHALFPTTAGVTDTAAVAMTPSYESLGSVEPLLLAETDNVSTGVIAASGLGILGLGGIALGAGGGGGGGGGNDNNGSGVTPTPPEAATPVITVNAFASDDILDNGEKGSAQTLSGTTTNVEAGQIVTVTLNGQAYNATVGADGSWSVSVPASALAALAAGTATFNVSVSNAAGLSASASHDFTVQPTASEPATPTIAVAAFAGDDVLDNNEKGSAQTLSGTTTNVEAGQVVTVNLNGQTYNAAVGADGSWSVNVPASALAALAAGTATFNVSVSNAAGLSASASHSVIVEPAAGEPGLIAIVEPLSGDGYLNAQEATADLSVSGRTFGVAEGAIVSLNFNGTSYSGTVNSDGSWNITIPSSAFTGIGNGTQTLTASVIDSSGTVLADSASLTVAVNTQLSAAIDTPFTDGILNGEEVTRDQTLSGNTGVVGEGQQVQVTLNGQIYSAVVGQDGSWNLNLPASALQLLSQGAGRLTVTVTDAAGNSETLTQDFTVDTLPPTLTLDPVATDNVLNSTEAVNDLPISGTGDPGDLITVTLNNQNYSATVDNNGSWSVTVPAAALAELADGSAYAVQVTTSDAAGNVATRSQTLAIDTQLPSLVVNTPGGDGVLTNTDLNQPLILSGSGAPGDTVVATLNGTPYNTVIGENGQWTISVPADALAALPAGDNAITVTVTDAVGNSNSQQSTINMAAATPTLDVDPLGGDGVINATDAGQPLAITGNGTAGDTISVSLNGQTYTATVNENGAWSVTIPSADLTQVPNGTQPVVISATDPLGNSSSSDESLTFSTTPPTVAITQPASDGYINSNESGQDLVLSGSGGTQGDSVSVDFAGTTYPATVDENGNWSVTVPAVTIEGLDDGIYPVTATVTDSAGNASTSVSDVTVVANALPTLTLDPFAGDDVLDRAEQLSDLQITGTTTNVTPGQTVTVTINGSSYDGVVQPGGGWSVTLPAGALSGLTGTQTFTATVTDVAGNSVTPVTGTYTVLETTDPLLAVSPVANDNALNAAEAAVDLTISGSSVNLPTGTEVTVALNGVTYSGVTDQSGNWTVTVPTADLSALAQGDQTVTITASGVEITQTLNVATTPLPVPTINTPFADGVLNSEEADSVQTLSGSTGVAGAGQGVQVIIGNASYQATVDAQGNWSVDLPPSALQALGQGNNVLTVTSSDAAGNSNSATATVLVDTVAPTLVVDPVAGDNIINADETQVDLTLSGNVAPGSTLALELGGNSYSAAVAADGSWSATVPAADLQALNDGRYDLTVTVTSPGGNEATTAYPVTVDTTAPDFSVNTPAGDGTLNASEQEAPLVLSGSGSAGDSVNVELNGVSYSTTIGSDGNWSLEVPVSDLSALNSGSNPISVTVSDTAGNSNVQQIPLTVDTALPPLSVDPVGGDGTLNSSELTQPLVLSGSGQYGDSVQAELNGKFYRTLVSVNGRWTLQIPQTDLATLPNGDNPLTVTLTDAQGNQTVQTSTLFVDADPATQPTLSVDSDTFAGNGIVDAAELQQPQTLTGSTTNVEQGQVVIVTLNGVNYSGVVAASGDWSVTLPAGAFAGLSDGSQTLSVSVADAAGNSASADVAYQINTSASSIAVAPVSGDNYLNATEAAVDFAVSGSTSNVATGSLVTVTLNGVAWSATVNADGSWSATVPAGALSGVPDGALTLTTSVVDAAGNTVTSSSTVNLLAASQPQPVLDPAFGDGSLNAQDVTAAGTLTGSTGLTGDGQSVSVLINGVSYSGTVDNAGNWSVSLPAETLAALPQGSNAYSVTLTDIAGNSATVDGSVLVDTVAPALSVNTPAGDGVLNAAEVTQPLDLTGSSDPNAQIVASFNGATYSTTADVNGNWTLTLPATAFSGLADTAWPLSITATDAAGNVASSDTTLAVKAGAGSLPVLTVNAFAGDNVIDGAERQTDQLLSGTTTNVEPGQIVTVTLGTQVYTAQVQASGSWSLTVSAGVLQQIADGTTTLSVAVTDAAGNPASQDVPLTFNSTASGLSLDAVSNDNYLNAQEADLPLIVTGSSANVPLGSTVTLLLNNQTYSAQVTAGGRWSIIVPAEALEALPDGANTLTVTTTDSTGATLSSNSTLNVLINTLPDPVVTSAFGDGTLNASDLNQLQTLSGTTGVSGDGQTVTVAFNGANYPATVEANGNWSLTLPTGALTGLSDGALTYTVTATDAAGNSNTTDASVAIDVTAPTLTIDAVTGDDVVNALESGAVITLSGDTDAGEGQRVTITLNGQVWTTTSGADGSWTFDLPAGALAGIAPGSYPLTATVSDAAGNAVTEIRDITVATATPGVLLDTPFTDGYLGSDEAAAGQTLSGSTGIAEAGQSVVVTLNGTRYDADVDAQGNWSLSLDNTILQALPEGTATITVTATDTAGNSGSIESSVVVDFTDPELTLNAISGDNVINSLEVAQDVTISGTASLQDAGQPVNVTLAFNGQNYQTQVLSDGTWSVILPASVMQGLPDGDYDISVTLTDAAGNSTTLTETLSRDADTADLPTLTLNAISTDGYVNAQEAGAALAISGTSTNLEAGQVVTVTLNDQNYSGTVGPDGSWSVSVPAEVVGALADGAQSLTVIATDVTGNPASVSGGFTVVASAAVQPTITFDAIAGNDVLNAQEAGQPLTISGASTFLEGRVITVVLNEVEYSATADANGNWNISVPVADLGNLPQGSVDISASATDLAGNPVLVADDFTVNSDAPALTGLTLDAGADLSLAEALAGLVVSGGSDPVAAGDAPTTVTVSLNGNSYTTTVGTDGSWSLTIPPADLQQLPDGAQTVAVQVTDADGNVTNGSAPLNVIVNNLPTLTLDTANTPFADGFLSQTESTGATTLNGTAANLADGTPVTVVIGNLTYTATVTNNAWSLAIPAGDLVTLDEGVTQITVSASDVVGNPAQISSGLEVIFTPPADPVITLPLFGDNTVNASEAVTAQQVSGTATLTDVQTLTVTVDGAPVPVTIDENGNWTAVLTPAQLGVLQDGTHTLTVTTTDLAGNSSDATQDFTLATAPIVAPTLDTAFGDNILNFTEAQSDGTLTGQLGAANAESVTVNINGTLYDAAVDTAAATWSLAIPTATLRGLPDGTWPVTVTVTDDVGNSNSFSSALQVAINTVPDATFTLPFGDGALSAAEAATAQTLSGNTGITSTGQTVSLIISGLNDGPGDQPLLATVDTSTGNWSYALTPEQMQALANGAHTISVTATDFAQNSDTVTQTVTTGVQTVTPTFDDTASLGTDLTLNIAEAAAGITLTGNTGSSGANQAVSVTVDANGARYLGTVDANGLWSVAIPAGTLSTLGTGAHAFNVTITDAAGNTTTTPFDFNAALTAPTPAVDAAYNTGYLNAQAVASGFTLTGTTGVTGAGQSVVVTMGDQRYDAGDGLTVDANGVWSLPLSNAQLLAFNDGTYPVSVTATDANGNSATISNTLTVDTAPPALANVTFAGDNVLDYAESQSPQLLSGTSTGAEPGSLVSVSFNGQTASTTVNGDGSWSILLSADQVASFTADSTIQVTLTDLAGNPVVLPVNVTVDLTPPAGLSAVLDPISGDNVINAADGATTTLNGTVSDATAAVTVTLNGVTSAATVNSDGTWSLTVDTATFGDDATVPVTVTATNGTETFTTSNSVVVDRTIPTLTINAFTGDGYVNAAESDTNQVITGTASQADAGRFVLVTLNGTTYSAVVQADGSWSAAVPAAAMQALPEGAQQISAQLSDAAGNTGTASQTITVDTATPLIQVDAILGDNILNATEIAAGTVLNGRVTNAQGGETVGLYAGDANPIATATVAADGTFSFNLTPGVLGDVTDGTLLFGVRVSDPAGNQTDATVTINKVVNSALNVVVDSIFGDGFLNAADTAVAQTITGTVASAGAGSVVSVALGDLTLSTTVAQDGRWSITVQPELLQTLTDGNLTANVTVTDANGNTDSTTGLLTAIVDNLPVVNTLTGLFGGDNLLNIAESLVDQTVSGTVSNAAAGSQVTVALGSHTYTTTVQAGGNWSVTLPTADLSSLLNGNLTLGVSVTDAAGNVATNSATIGIFTAQPTISLTSLFGDGILNAADILTSQTISGVVNNVAAGSTVNLTLGGTAIGTATVGQDGAFSATVTPDILGALAQGNLSLGVNVQGLAGNTVSTTATVRVDTLLPTVTINPLFGDGLLNVADALLNQTVSGVIGGAEAGSRVTVSVAGQQLATTTDANGNFSVTLTPAILQGIADGNLTVNVSVTDSAGNTASSTAGALVGIHNLPQITLNPLFGDGVLNLAESLVTQTISGTISNVAQGTAVRINIGTTTLNATVGANGAFSAQVSPDLLGTLLTGNLTVGVAVTDAVGNVSSVSAGVQLGLTQPTLTLNTVFGDGILSAGDLTTNQTISGTSTNLATGTTVSTTLNGVTYTTKVTSGGSWSISVPRADLATIADGTVQVTVSASDAYGNPASTSGNLSVISHTPPTVTISSLFGDNALSVADVKTAQTISGTATNAEGSTVSVQVGSQTFTTTVNSSGAWSLSIPAATLAAIADGSYTVTASVTNGAGVSGSGSSALTVISHTSPTVALNTYFGGDGYLNIAEANTAETISGTTTHAVGSTVSVNLAGHVFTTTVTSSGTWSISVPTSTLVTIPDGSQSLSVTVTDAGGNTAITNSTFTALSHNTPQVGVDPVLSVVTSLLVGLSVTGGTSNAAPGSNVTVTLLLANGNPGPSVNTTTDALGRFGAVFAPSLLSVSGLGLSLSTLARVTVTDVAGNSSTVTNTLLLGSLLPVTTAATASVATFSVDDTSAAVASTEDNSATTSTGTGEETFAKMATVATVATPDSTLTTDADDTTASSTATTASTSDDTTSATATAAVADDQSYTIGGVVIALADGTTAEGASVTGSAGADTVTVSDLHFTHIDGGAGTDTLVLNGENMTLDLTALGLKVEHIEIVDLGKSGTNAVKLDLNEALNITDTQNEDLVIKGADGSQVMLANANGGVWENTGQRALDGQTFDVYHNSALTSDNTLGDVLVQHNLQVHVV